MLRIAQIAFASCMNDDQHELRFLTTPLQTELTVAEAT